MSYEDAWVLCAYLRVKGYEGYIVGGRARAEFTHEPIHDIDLATNATPDQIKEVFKEGMCIDTKKEFNNPYIPYPTNYFLHIHNVVPTGEKFGTITVVAGLHPYEITTYRSEGKYLDKRHPETIQWETDLVKDLSRRDFTINAMAIDPTNYCQIIDPFKGREDIKNEIIRCVGEPDERFGEDRLRMLRTIRFAGKLNFRIDDETFHSIKRNHSFISEISAERIRDELLKMMETNNPYFCLEYLNQTGLLNDILPEVAKLKDITQPSRHHQYTVMYHLFEVVRFLPKEKPLLRFAGLMHDIGKVEVNPNPPPCFPAHAMLSEKLLMPILERLKFSTEDSEYIRYIVATHMDFFNVIDSRQTITKRTGRRFLASHRLDLMDDYFDFVRADINGTGMKIPPYLQEVDDFEKFLHVILEEKPPLSKKDLAINGNDIMALGIPPSPKIGEIQDFLVNAVIFDPSLNNREKLLELAKEFSAYAIKS